MSKTKLIIVESGDRLGKSSLIKGLCENYDYKNITLRHCDKPPKNLSSKEVLDFQFKCFKQEFELITYVSQLNDKFSYHDNIIIYDRFYLGEYVYGQLFRNVDPKEIKDKIEFFEKYYLSSPWLDTYLITLTATAEFFFQKEDGQSFSQTLEDKAKELKLFIEAHQFSQIKNKLLVKVDNENKFKSKQEILDEVLTFLNV